MHTFPVEVEHGNVLPSFLNAHTANKYPSHGLFSVTLFTFLCFWSLIVVLRMAPKCSAQGPASVAKGKKAVCDVLCGENTCVR